MVPAVTAYPSPVLHSLIMLGHEFHYMASGRCSGDTQHCNIYHGGIISKIEYDL